MKIFPKLFIAFAASFLAVIALMVVTLDWSFEQGFLKYIHESEVRELELFASELEDYYGEVQTWEFIRANPRIADVLLNERRLFDQNIIVTSRKPVLEKYTDVTDSHLVRHQKTINLIKEIFSDSERVSPPD